MISLNQIRLLEQKIESILDLVSALQIEKAALENQNTKLKAEVQELAAKCSRFEQDEPPQQHGRCGSACDGKRAIKRRQ